MFSGGIPALIQTIAAASVPAKVAVVAAASVTTVAAGAPVVATISDAVAAEAPATTQVTELGDDVTVTTASPATTSAPDEGDGSDGVAAAPAPTTTAPSPATTTTTTTEAPPPIDLQLWCGRTDVSALEVVCEWATSRHDGFTFYVVLRNGAAVAEIPNRPDSDAAGVRWVDERPTDGEAVYVVHVIDADGNVMGASNAVVVTAPEPTTTTTEEVREEEPEREKDPAPTTTAPKDEEPEEQWESIGIWCARSSNSTEPGVVCEFGISERDDFAFYVLKRDGVIIWEYGQRTMPGRPWPDIRYVDTAAPAGQVGYAAYIVDTDGNWVGGSGTLTLESTIEEEPAPTTTEPPPTTEPEEEPPPTTEPEESPWEELNIGCGRSDETPSTVFCEFSASTSDDFGFYILKRNGVGILESADRYGQLFTDTEAPTAQTTYAVYVLDSSGDWIGSSYTFTVPAVD